MRANPLKGETELVVGKKTYILALQANELCALEKLEDVGLEQIQSWFNDRSKLRVTNFRSVLWAALQRHHSDVDLIAAGNIMSEAGVTATIQKLGEALQASFPEARPDESGNPQTGQV